MEPVESAAIGERSEMHTIELSDDELRLLREALRSFMDDFGHDEIDVVRRVQALLAKLPG
jgi:hypothetical protein